MELHNHMSYMISHKEEKKNIYVEGSMKVVLLHYSFYMYSNIQSLDSCHDKQFFLSSRMHPVTYKSESLDASGDSTFRVARCIR